MKDEKDEIMKKVQILKKTERWNYEKVIKMKKDRKNKLWKNIEGLQQKNCRFTIYHDHLLPSIIKTHSTNI